MKLGENIYKYRTELGLSQGGLADALEVSRQSVSKWENSSAVPELDKLIRMTKLFQVTLDELVYGKKEVAPSEPPPRPAFPIPSPRIVIGVAMLLFGMVFFLFSVFFGDKLRFGEEFGELLSISIVLVSVSLLATYNQAILAACALIYFIYDFVCIGVLNVSSMTNYVFLFLAGVVILVWFIVLGLHETNPKKKYPVSS